MEKVFSLFGQTVFSNIPKNAVADKILAILFHRSAAMLYLIYAAWGLTSMFGFTPIIILTEAGEFQRVFAVAIFAFSTAAFFGALFFPRRGRLELFAGAGVSALIAFYVGSLFLAGFMGNDPDAAKIPGAVYGASHLVVPIARTIFIYLTLIKKAAKEV